MRWEGGDTGAWMRGGGDEKRQGGKRGRRMYKYTNWMVWSDGSYITRGVGLA